MRGPKSLAEQIADLDDPAPRDLDPEGQDEPSSEDLESDGGVSELDGREHYETVGKSNLRKSEGVALGPQYSGSRISRDALLDDDGYDDPFGIDETGSKGSEQSSEVDTEDMGADGSEDTEDEAGPVDKDPRIQQGDSDRTKASRSGMSSSGDGVNGTLNGAPNEAPAASEEDSDRTDVDEIDGLDDVDIPSIRHIDESNGNTAEDSDSNESEDEDVESDEDGGYERQQGKDTQRAQLRKMMGEEQKMVAATISEAAKADARKGRAVKHQRKTFDSLLNTRIQLQKGLIATNTLPIAQAQEASRTDDKVKAYATAEAAALKLWNQLNALRHEISKSTSNSSNTGSKRKFVADDTTLTTVLRKEIQAHDSGSLPTHRATLEKWSSKVHGTNALTATRNKLNPNSSSHQQPITSVLDAHLADPSRLISRARTPRSCAPVQASRPEGHDNSIIFDDADFYQLLLKELVDQRMMDTPTASSNTNTMTSSTITGADGMPGVGTQWTATREAKTRKKVDTRASKGRKLRYTVHEKLQNFMAPEDRGKWGPRQVDELFGSLLGRRMRLEEGDDEDVESEDDIEGGSKGERLMLFRT
ncbi:MAG: rRNA-processing protein bfr2 [Sclerophora amabilis]|nr:MAG: rRNA-processing protein bfr2 [Sclerophora amabilis]